MNILIYGEKGIAELIRSCGTMQYRQICFVQPDSYDEYLASLQKEQPELIVVSQSGALGMEAAIAARETHSKTPLIWFSDDEAFCVQSYRLDCTYFTAKPVDKATAEAAITHYFKKIVRP